MRKRDVATLDEAQCLAIAMAAVLHPALLDEAYEAAKRAADYSVESNAGRQLALFPRAHGESPMEVKANMLLIEAERRASQLGCSRLDALRASLVPTSRKHANDHASPYVRIAVK